MEDLTTRSSPWVHTIKLLQNETSLAPEVVPLLSYRLPEPCPPKSSRVTVTGRPSSKTIMVMWCNPTLGRYGAQTWCITTAYEAGLCELSGSSIVRGDIVYRPRHAYPAPVNGKSMILACFVRCEELETEFESNPAARCSKTRKIDMPVMDVSY